MKQPSVKDSWAAVIQDIYDEEIDTNLLNSEEIVNHQEPEENIGPQNSQQAQSFNYSAIDHVAMGLYVTIDQEAAMDQGILNVITNWNTNPTCIFFMYENVYHLSNNSNKHFI